MPKPRDDVEHRYKFHHFSHIIVVFLTEIYPSLY